MQKRQADAARLGGVPESLVQEVSVTEVRRGLVGRVPAEVLAVGTQEPATYWRIRDHYFLDDPLFGDVVDFADLEYDSDLGLHIRHSRGA